MPSLEEPKHEVVRPDAAVTTPLRFHAGGPQHGIPGAGLPPPSRHRPRPPCFACANWREIPSASPICSQVQPRSLARTTASTSTRMLAVDVEREDASGYLSEGVKAPGFPSTIDHLWLFDRRSSTAFHTKRDDSRLGVSDLPR